MSEFKINEFTFKGKTYKFKQPLILSINRNCAFNDELGLSVVVYKQMPGQLERDINGQICMLWEGYALCPDEKLSTSGLEVTTPITEVTGIYQNSGEIVIPIS